MIQEKESRTKLSFLHELLVMVKREAENLHEELISFYQKIMKAMAMTLEDIRFSVDECSNETNKHLISGRDDSLSDTCPRRLLLINTLQDLPKKKFKMEVHQT